MDFLLSFILKGERSTTKEASLIWPRLGRAEWGGEVDGGGVGSTEFVTITRVILFFLFWATKIFLEKEEEEVGYAMVQFSKT